MSDIEKLLEVMKRLRDPQTGCPWDVRQSFESIAPYTIEEAYEIADAIERCDMPALRDELGDLLFQVAFHAEMAAEAGLFDFDDVVDSISSKMIRRHPHVFGTAEERAAGIQDGSWEHAKVIERTGGGDESALAGVARALPALKKAQKLGLRAASVGFDWDDPDGVREKIHEELEEFEVALGSRDEAHIEEEFGDFLFAVVNLARHWKIDPEKALMGANAKFERRFRDMEKAVTARGKALKRMSLAALEQEWRAAKKRLS